MIRKYTEAEMLSLYKRRMGLFEARNGGVVSRQDGSHLDEYLLTEMRAWYAQQLQTADIALLPVEDVSDEIESKLYVDESTAEIILPARGVRLAGIKLAEWNHEVTTFYPSDSDMAQLQRNKYLRATIRHPVVVLEQGKAIVYGVERPKMNLDPTVPQPMIVSAEFIRQPIEVESLRMVAMPTDGEYVFDDTLLLTIN